MALKLIPIGTTISFMRGRYAAGVLSAALLLLTLGLLVTKGLNFGIDFAGGNLIQIQTKNDVEVSALRTALNTANIEGVTIQNYGGADEFLLRAPAEADADAKTVQESVLAALRADIGDVEIRRVEFVGPQVGSELREAGLIAMLCALGAILVYISFRFELRYGVGAIVALSHDVLLTIGMFVLLQKEVSLPVLAAVLTVIGYSLNDTIVVFDRIREVRGRYPQKLAVAAMDMALNQTLGRTLMTSLTTLVVLMALFFLGGSVIHDFAFTLLFGVIVGTYSSIFIAAPILLLFENYYQKVYAEREYEDAEERP